MKTLLLLLPLLLAGAARAANPGDTVFTSGGSGTLLDNGDVMGPLCPPSICPPPETDPAASAFNAAASLPPDGTRWASPTCTRIPCALVDVPKEEAAAGAGTAAGAGAAVGFSTKRNTGAGSVNAVPPGERTIVATSKGEQSCDSYSCRPVTDDERAKAAAQEKAIQDRDRGFCPSGNCGSTSDTGRIASFAADDAGDDGANEAFDAGSDMGGSDIFGHGGNAFDGGSTAGNGGTNAGALAAGQDGKTSKARYGAPVSTDGRTWATLEVNGANALRALERTAGVISATGAPDPNDGTERSCKRDANGVVVAGCDFR